MLTIVQNQFSKLKSVNAKSIKEGTSNWWIEMGKLWSRDNAHLSVFIARVAVFFALYKCIGAHVNIFAYNPTDLSGIEKFLASKDIALWKPHGFAMLFGGQPNAETISFFFKLAFASSILTIIGLGTRIAAPIAAISTSMLVALSVSWSGYWSHGWNVNCLAALALMFLRPGKFSVDGLIATYAPVLLRRVPKSMADLRAPLWPVLLAQAAVALFLFTAFIAKLGWLEGHVTLEWVFSDNIRNALANPYIQRGYEPPWWVSLTVSHPLFYIGAAFGHMAMQALPILAIFSHKPFSRLFEGVLFLLGIALLFLFMTLGVFSWVYIAAVFVDWEYYIGKLTKKSPMWTYKKPSMSAKRFSIMYIIFFCFISLLPFKTVRDLPFYDGRMTKRFYPFSPMDFYSNVSDQVTFKERRSKGFIHRPYNGFYGNVVTISQDGVKNDYRGYFRASLNYAIGGRPVGEREAHVRGVYNNIQTRKYRDLSKQKKPWSPNRYFPPELKAFDESNNKYTDVIVDVFGVPAYPDNAFNRILIAEGFVGRYVDETDTVLTANATVKNQGNNITHILTEQLGYTNPEFKLHYYVNPIQASQKVELKPLPGEWVSDKVWHVVKEDPKAWIIMIEVNEAGKDDSILYWGPNLYGIHLKDKS